MHFGGKKVHRSSYLWTGANPTPEGAPCMQRWRRRGAGARSSYHPEAEILKKKSLKNPLEAAAVASAVVVFRGGRR